MSTTTSILGMQLPVDGEAGWSAMMRGNFQALDAAAGGQNLLKTFTGGTYTLSATESRKDSFELNGALTANQIIIFPNVMQPFAIENLCTGAFNLIAKTATGLSVYIPKGVSICYANGTDVELIYAPIAGSILSFNTTTIAATMTKVGLTATGNSSGGMTLDTTNSRVTIVNPGTYRLAGRCGGTTTAAAQTLSLQFYLNGAPLTPVAKNTNTAAVVADIDCYLDHVITLAANDYVELFASSTVASGVLTQAYRCSLIVQRV